MASAEKPRQTLTWPLLAGLALLSAGGPFGTDLYLPGLPRIAADLGTSDAAVQLTLSSFMLGMAAGQVFIGPLSDSLGRHKLLVISAVLAVVSSAACALAPNIAVLIGARAALGLGMGACVVLSRASVADLAEGKMAAKAFSLLMMIMGVAPILAPVVGSVLVEPIGWRGLFWVLTGVAAAQLAVAVLLVRESLPVSARSQSGLAQLGRNFRTALGNRAFLGYTLAFGAGFGTMFSYIAASAYLFQTELGLSPLQYGLCFGMNAAGITIASFLNARLVEKTDPHAILRRALLGMLLCAVALLIDALVGPHLFVVIPVLFVAVSQIGFVMGNATALGTSQVRRIAGTGSAVMGAAQFLTASLVSPLVVLGSNTALSMALGMVVCASLANFGAAIGGRKSVA
ncbi:multidrug effflux MFS transporter [Corynebacterium epidermidicanis]|uniref:Drug resistance transporter, Bcr/CflA subfamily n=1 Tax=Corynebacterium epidermidicanis TaxID=1050174 RepID=A0A0G3GTZ8_9CORY|nr:multidrug effflux MFS transporter [Corynebacterium epidermidicanis]AKK04025.1 drug resistance transporter, Bcr/CflA subfamily [Corynebacterium epidermidicanis]